jgi:hypothetical protein
MKLTVLTITGCLAATMALPVISLADGKNAAEERQTITPPNWRAHKRIGT